MTENAATSAVDRVLARVAASFRLDTRIGGRPLSGLIAEAVTRAAATAEASWGSSGDPAELERIVSPALTFFYRPHLFPGMDEDLRLGHAVQYQLLPQRLPPEAPLEVAALLESYCHLSGDVFGWRAEPDGALTVWLFDVSGHGLRAGFAALVLTLLIESSPHGLAVEDLCEQVEARFLAARNPADRSCLYATGVVLQVAANGAMSTVCAGHPPPLLRRASGAIEELEVGALPLALVPGRKAAAARSRLAPGDLVLVFSDGLVEVVGRNGQPFGTERTAATLAAASEGPEEVASRLYSEVSAHHDLSRLDDDLSFLVLRLPLRPEGRENQRAPGHRRGPGVLPSAP